MIKFNTKLLLSVTLSTAMGSVLLANPSLAVTFTPFADAYINRGTNIDPTTNQQFRYSNYGTRNSLIVQNDFYNFNSRKSYIQFRFDPTQLSSNIGEVKLDLTLTKLNLNSTMGQLSLYGLIDNIAPVEEGLPTVETNITWMNVAGNNTNSSSGFDSKAQLLATMDIADDLVVGDTLSFKSSDFANLKTYFENDTDGLVTFMLSRDNPGGNNKNGLVFASKENNEFYGPQLHVEELELEIPESSSLFGVLVVGGSLVLGSKLKESKAKKS